MKTNWTTTPITTTPRIEAKDDSCAFFAAISRDISMGKALEMFAANYDTGDMEDGDTTTVRLTMIRADGTAPEGVGAIIADGRGGVRSSRLTRWTIEEA
jgi:hypothetical protein